MNKAAAKYDACIAKAESTADPVKADALRLKCHDKLNASWQKLLDAAAAAGSTCVSTTPPADFADFIDACVESVAATVGGDALPADVATCNDDLGTCGDELGTCGDNLSNN